MAPPGFLLGFLVLSAALLQGEESLRLRVSYLESASLLLTCATCAAPPCCQHCRRTGEYTPWWQLLHLTDKRHRRLRRVLV